MKRFALQHEPEGSREANRLPCQTLVELQPSAYGPTDHGVVEERRRQQADDAERE